MCSEKQQSWGGEDSGGDGERDASRDKGEKISRRFREAIGETLAFLTQREGRRPFTGTKLG